jgi:hypothetical protein
VIVLPAHQSNHTHMNFWSSLNTFYGHAFPASQSR